MAEGFLRTSELCVRSYLIELRPKYAKWGDLFFLRVGAPVINRGRVVMLVERFLSGRFLPSGEECGRTEGFLGAACCVYNWKVLGRLSIICSFGILSCYFGGGR